MKSLKLLLILPVLIACKHPLQKKASERKKIYVDTVTQVDTLQKPFVLLKKSNLKFNDILLKQYASYVDTLNKFNIENSHLAVDKFKNMFVTAGEKLRDSAFYIFNKHYAQLAYNIDSLYTISSIRDRGDSLLNKNLKTPLSKELVLLKDKLQRNGYEIFMTEGDSYIGLDMDFIGKYFYGKISPVLKKYLVQKNKENKYPETEDASIIISSRELIDRLIWWEDFNKNYPDFIYTDEVISNENFYLTMLLSGTDNTNLIDIDDNKKITDFYKKAAIYLQKKYPSSPSATIIPACYKAILNGKRSTCKPLFSVYLKKGILSDKEVDNIINPS